MGFIRKLAQRWLGVDTLEERIGKLEDVLDINSQHARELKIMSILIEPMTTREIAKKLGICRSRASQILNILERQGRVQECGRRGKQLLYKKI